MQTRTTTIHDLIGLSDAEMKEITNALQYTNEQDMCIDPDVMEGLLNQWCDSEQPETNDTEGDTVTVQTHDGEVMELPINHKFDSDRIRIGMDVTIVASGGKIGFVVFPGTELDDDEKIVGSGVILDSTLFGRR